MARVGARLTTYLWVFPWWFILTGGRLCGGGFIPPAAADFVVALYNPKSGRRTRHPPVPRALIVDFAGGSSGERMSLYLDPPMAALA